MQVWNYQKMRKLSEQILLDKIERPIGIFDSGIGGVTVLKEIIKILPNEEYEGD